MAMGGDFGAVVAVMPCLLFCIVLGATNIVQAIETDRPGDKVLKARASALPAVAIRAGPGAVRIELGIQCTFSGSRLATAIGLVIVALMPAIRR